MFAMNNAHRTIALDALSSILNNANYFIADNESYSISPTLHPQLKAAHDELKLLLRPITTERLRQIIVRLIMHFSTLKGNQQREMLNGYIAALHTYPEDLLSSAYIHTLTHHRQRCLPSIASLIEIIEPPYLHRQSTYRKVEWLLSRLEKELNI